MSNIELAEKRLKQEQEGSSRRLPKDAGQAGGLEARADLRTLCV